MNGERAVKTMRVLDEPLSGVLHLQPEFFEDERGWFVESFNRRDLALLGLDVEFVQDNQSFSRSAGTVRGLHLQLQPFEQGKLVQVLSGAIFDVAVDVRPNSTGFGQHCGVRLCAEVGNQMWVPAGFAHGFCTLEPDTRVLYKVTSHYEPSADRSVQWNDPELDIRWPVDEGAAVLSEKDRIAPPLSALEGVL